MKKVFLLALTAFVMLAVPTAHANANTDPIKTTVVEVNPMDSELAISLNTRLSEINEMDKSGLTKSEKRSLKKETREINKELKAIGNGGVYLSVGALLIIVLLVILLV